jgi:hypothetical protein
MCGLVSVLCAICWGWFQLLYCTIAWDKRMWCPSQWYFIIRLLLHRFVLVHHRINLLPHYTFTTKLPTSIPYSFSLIFPLSISTVFSWYLHYLIMGSSLVSLKCLGAVWMDLKIKTFILIVKRKGPHCAHIPYAFSTSCTCRPPVEQGGLWQKQGPLCC